MKTTKKHKPVSEPEFIEVHGARVHNLKNVDVNLPRKKLVVITGISGSGKSSLAFDTIYAEGQRRYMETFSNYARQFIGGMERPEVDNITGLSPVISIEQKTVSKNPRSTVGTITEIYDFLRLLYARAADAYSYVSGKKMEQYTENQVIDSIRTSFADKKIAILGPEVRGRKGHYRELFDAMQKRGFLKVRVDGEIVDIVPKMQVDRYKVHDIEAVVDRLSVKEENESRLLAAIEKAMKIGDGLIYILDLESNISYPFSKNLMDSESGISYDTPSPNTFSYNSPYGMCPSCKGLGYTMQVNEDAMIPDSSLSINKGGIAPLGERREGYLFKELKRLAKKYNFNLADPVKDLDRSILNLLLYGDPNQEEPSDDVEISDADRWYSIENGGVQSMLVRSYRETSSDSIRRWAEQFMEQEPCETCEGYRLKKESLSFKIDGLHIGQMAAMNLGNLVRWLDNIEARLSVKQREIATEVLKEIRERLSFLLDVGLEYLSLDRSSRSLSGGEAQRIRLATQIGSQLSGVTYILDEPSIGLHQRDNERLINSLQKLAAGDNSVLVVEHDKDIMLACDYLIDIGPGAGEHGGEIVAQGTPDSFKTVNTLTADYLFGRREIPVPTSRRKGNGKAIELFGMKGNNLKNLDLKFDLGKFICVTGVSGSGKSTIINETLYPILHSYVYKARTKPLAYSKIKGLEHIDKVIEIDQSPIGRTPRSNPATYIKVFDEIRKLFSMTPEALIRGFNPGRFSFNVKGGRCEACGGGGIKVIEMNFLPDVEVECDVCFGKRYNRETLEVRYKGKSIYDVLEMTVEDACIFFESLPRIYRKLKTLQDVGLGYLRLGQSSTTISGGEAQRVKLSSELSKKDTGSTFYILDEPTTGLHFEDIRVLLNVLNELVDRGNTVLVIEHNMDVIKLADHVIDIGPEGGEKGGTIVFQGSPEELAKHPTSHTAKFLKLELK
ncbi:MAG: excinuclease ABC subunit UvrA [Chitinophagales bacterium]